MEDRYLDAWLQILLIASVHGSMRGQSACLLISNSGVLVAFAAYLA
jgi:hypothetical protein